MAGTLFSRKKTLQRAFKGEGTEVAGSRGQKYSLIVDDEKVPLIGRGADMENGEIQLEQQIHIRDNGNAEALGHQSGDDLILLCLIGDNGDAARRGKQVVHHLPQAGTFGKIDLGIGQRFFQAYAAPPGQRVAGGDDKHQILPGYGKSSQVQPGSGLEQNTKS